MTYSNKTLLFLSAFSVLMIAFSGFQAKAQTLIAPSFLSGDSFTTGVTGFITAGEPGENMTWDYSDALVLDSYVTTVLPSSPSPFEDDYPGANWILDIPAASQSLYLNLGPDYYEYFGGVEQGSSYPLTNSERFFPYPFTFGDTWTDGMSGTLNIAGLIINRSGIVESTVDGYGSISLPGGIQLDDVTRVNLHRVITDSSEVGVDIYIVDHIMFYEGTMLAPLVNHTHLQIVSPLDTTIADYFEILQGYAVGIDQVVDQETGVEFGMFPNPATDKVQVVTSSFGNGGSAIEIIEVRDITGRLVEAVRPISGLNVTVFDVSSWMSGVYTVTVNPGEPGSTTKQLIIE